MILSIVILTMNEEIHIGRAIESLRPLAIDYEIVVVDSGSTDSTVSIAENLGASVYYHPFVNQAAQLQWALDEVPLRGHWVMRLDADEYVSRELCAELSSVLPSAPADVTGLVINRRHIFQGRWIKHGGRYPLKLLRVWRAGTAHVEQRWMDEHVVLDHGNLSELRGHISDHNLKDLSYFTSKHNAYATREAIEVLVKRYRLQSGYHSGVGAAVPQAARKRYLKDRIYNRLPYGLAARLYYWWRMTVQLGVLDGREGRLYHFLQGLWYRSLVGAKVDELSRQLDSAQNVEERLDLLKSVVGTDLNWVR